MIDVSQDRVDKAFEKLGLIKREVQTEFDKAEKKCKCHGYHHEVDCSFVREILSHWLFN